MRGSGQTPESAPRPSQGMVDVALHAAVLDIAVVCLLWGAHVIQATQAILPTYYPLLGTLYRCVPALWILHALLMLTVAGVAFDQRPELDERLQHLLGAFLWRGRGTDNHPYHFKPFVQSAPAPTPERRSTP